MSPYEIPWEDAYWDQRLEAYDNGDLECPKLWDDDEDEEDDEDEYDDIDRQTGA